MHLSQDNAIQKIIRGLLELFPQVGKDTVRAETALGEMPEWDSMAGVNLQTYLLQQFNIEVPLELLSDDTTLNEIAAFLINPIPSEVA